MFFSISIFAEPICDYQFEQAPSKYFKNSKIGDVLPDLETGSSIEVGEDLIRWIRKMEVEKAAPSNLVIKEIPLNFETESSIMLLFTTEDLSSFQKNGFQNIHQTGKSNGINDIEKRIIGEDEIVGLRMGSGDEALKLRPKSAVLQINSNVDLGKFTNSKTVFLTYGTSAAVMKSSVKNRSLWISGDSLRVSDYYREVEELGPKSYRILNTITENQMRLKKYHASRGTFKRNSYIERNNMSEFETGKAYIEALVFGEVKYSDVDHFVFAPKSNISGFGEDKTPFFEVIPGSLNGRPHVIYVRALNESSQFAQELPLQARVHLFGEKVKQEQSQEIKLMLKKFQPEKSFTKDFEEFLLAH